MQLGLHRVFDAERGRNRKSAQLFTPERFSQHHVLPTQPVDVSPERPTRLDGQDSPASLDS